MKKNKIREKFISLSRDYEMELLKEEPLITTNNNDFLRMSSFLNISDMLTSNLKYKNQKLAIVQRCMRTTDKIVDIVGKEGVATIFNSMMSFFFFEQDNPRVGIKFLLDFLINSLSIKGELLYCAVNENHAVLIDYLVTNGLRKENIVNIPKNKMRWNVESYPNLEGIYMKFFIVNNNGLLPVASINFINYHKSDGIKLIDSSLILEVLTVATSGVDSIYETGIFLDTINHLNELDIEHFFSSEDKYFITNLMRGIVMALGDGVRFDNAKAGYVIRKLFRQCIIRSYSVGIREPFIFKIVMDTFKGLEISNYEYSNEIMAHVKEMVYIEEEKYRALIKKNLKWIDSFLENNHKIEYIDLVDWNQSKGIPEIISYKYLKDKGIKIKMDVSNQSKGKNNVPMNPLYDYQKMPITEWIYALQY
ncbi:MAG: alanine--tRNA ligase-related protein [Candidatus Izemoplasmataceae bacterium]